MKSRHFLMLLAVAFAFVSAFGFAQSEQARPRAKAKWEYKIVSTLGDEKNDYHEMVLKATKKAKGSIDGNGLRRIRERFIGKMSEDGWELICVDHFELYFKRKVRVR